MAIHTHTPAIEATRRTILKLLANEIPPGKVVADTNSEFARWITFYGLQDRLRGRSDPRLTDSSHPLIHTDMSACILCYRCVRICEEVAGQSVWRAWNRGAETRIRPAGGGPLAPSDCTSCGACVDTCPTGAIHDAGANGNDPPFTETRTVCPYCAVGCEVYLATSAEGKVSFSRPATDAVVNRGHVCAKGRYGFDFVHAPDRVTDPLVRLNGGWRHVSWEDAIARVARTLTAIRDRFGPDSIGILGSARATNEENYLTQKFARVVIGTNNVDCCARVCHAPSAAALKRVFGTGAATNSFADIEQARAFLVCGANPSENHPVVGARIQRAVEHGARLVVIDPRRTHLATHAEHHLQLLPGTNVALLNAMACAIVEEGLYDRSFVPAHLQSWEEYRAFIRQFLPERVAPICRVEAELIRAAARLYASTRPAMSFHGLGVTEHEQGTDGVLALANLAILTGNIGKAGSGVNPLRGQNNVQGAAHMGCEPGTLTGGVALKAGRAAFEKAWRLALPSSPGMDLMQMMDAASCGRLKALWVIGYDVALTNPEGSFTAAALNSLDFLVVQDMFLNETARHGASVFLPAASVVEKDGTFMNSERRVQRIRQSIPPVGHARPDWRIICDLAAAMGMGESFAYPSPERIWDEIRSVWPAAAGITYPRLDHGGIQWPCPAEDHPGTPILHGDILKSARTFPLVRVDFHDSSERTTATFPFLLTTGRCLHRFNSGTMTSRSRTAKLHPTDVLNILPLEALRLGLADGDRVRLSSKYGRCSLPVRFDSSLMPGVVFATFHDPAVSLNQVIGTARDPMTHTPQYKLTAVRIDRA
jgi:formate dehydrogenase major subunit